MRREAGASSAAPVMEEGARWASQQWTNGQPYIPTIQWLYFKSTPLGQSYILTIIVFKSVEPELLHIPRQLIMIGARAWYMKHRGGKVVFKYWCKKRILKEKGYTHQVRRLWNQYSSSNNFFKITKHRFQADMYILKLKIRCSITK